MECSKVKELLSEYLDGMLDEKTSALVDEHLSACAGCREEHDSLKALVQELGSMESVTPPEDFLARLHERIEQPSWFSRLMRTLFVPMRFKVPLEFAAVAVMAFVVFSILNVQFGAYRASKGPEEPMQEEVAERPVMESARMTLKQVAPAPRAPVEKRMAKELEEESKPVELVLILKEERPSRVMPKASSMRAPLSGRDRLKSSAKIAVQPGFEKGDDARHGTMAAGGLAPLEDKAQPSPSYPPDVFQNVRDAITMLGGQVVTTKDAWQMDDSQAIIAHIPAKNYPSLLEELRPLGTLQSPVEKPSVTHEGPIQIRIKVSPKN